MARRIIASLEASKSDLDEMAAINLKQKGLIRAIRDPLTQKIYKAPNFTAKHKTIIDAIVSKEHPEVVVQLQKELMNDNKYQDNTEKLKDSPNIGFVDDGGSFISRHELHKREEQLAKSPVMMYHTMRATKIASIYVSAVIKRLEKKNLSTFGQASYKGES